MKKLYWYRSSEEGAEIKYRLGTLTRTHTLTQKGNNVINTGRRGVGLTQLKPAHL